MRRNFSFGGANPWARARVGLLVLAGILVVGTIGYLALGLSTLEALYYTVITVSTVGFSEPPGQADDAYRIFTILLILFGTGTVLYILGVLLEVLIEGRLTDEFRRQRMQRQIEKLTGHVIVCGFGQVGRAISEALQVEGRTVVVVDRLSQNLKEVEFSVEGDMVCASVVFGHAYEGPPGHVHGGIVAAAFDELLGATQALSGSPGMTGQLSVSYRAPTPLHVPLRFESTLDSVEGRKITTSARLYAGETLCAEARGLFISVDFAKIASMRADRDDKDE